MKRPRLPAARVVKELLALLLVAAAALAVRAWVVGIYAIPSASMLPRLFVGDYVLVAKFPFRFSDDLPRRGDVLVFRAPPLGEPDYVKRVIALPGDTVALRNGRLILNGVTLPRWRVADLLLPETPNSPCASRSGPRVTRERQPDSRWACRYRRYREMLPEGTMLDSIDIGQTTGDDFAQVRVPTGRLFLLGDNRDASADSRFPAKPGGAIGLVPVKNVVGRVELTLFSFDGSARLAQPRSWLRALRWERIGGRF